MSFEIKKANRTGVKPLIGLYSESGCGKTYSSLLLARGLVGPTGKIVMIDTESGRGSLYADIPEIGGYEVLELTQPFSPALYMEAIETVEKAKADVLIIDSGSHQWEGSGGVLDMATENEAKSGKPGLHNWRQPKMEHQKFMLKLLQSPLPIIVNLRAKYKTRQGKDEKGRTVIIKDDATSPIQAEDFIYEMMAHAEILPKHNILLTKCSHPSLRECFPTREQGPITIQHGELIAKWCQAAGQPASAPATENKKPASQVVELQTKLWKLLAGIRTPGHKGWDEVNNFLAINKIGNSSATTMSAEQLQDAIDKSKVVLAEQQEAGLL